VFGGRVGAQWTWGATPAAYESDIVFRPDAAIRLLLADRDVASGIYPIKRFNWPSEGIPAGMTREQFEDAYTDYPFNLVAQRATGVSNSYRRRQFH
jgi:hypothetical protein